MSARFDFPERGQELMSATILGPGWLACASGSRPWYGSGRDAGAATARSGAWSREAARAIRTAADATAHARGARARPAAPCGWTCRDCGHPVPRTGRRRLRHSAPPPPGIAARLAVPSSRVCQPPRVKGLCFVARSGPATRLTPAAGGHGQGLRPLRRAPPRPCRPRRAQGRRQARQAPPLQVLSRLKKLTTDQQFLAPGVAGRDGRAGRGAQRLDPGGRWLPARHECRQAARPARKETDGKTAGKYPAAYHRKGAGRSARQRK